MDLWEAFRQSDKNRTRTEQMYDDAFALCNSPALQNETLAPAERTAVENGLPCDRLPEGNGPFGTAATNPIPVNGSFGEWMYLSRLRILATGSKVFFHKWKTDGVVDAFEVINRSGTLRTVLYFSPCHPYASRYCPEGYILEREAVFPRGITTHSSCFPRGLYKEIKKEARRRLGIEVAEEESKYIEAEIKQ